MGSMCILLLATNVLLKNKPNIIAKPGCGLYDNALAPVVFSQIIMLKVDAPMCY